MNIRLFTAEVSLLLLLLLLSNESFNGAGVYISTIVKDGVVEGCSNLTWILSRTIKRFLQRNDAGIEGLGGELVVDIVAKLDKNGVNHNTVLCISYIWQFMELPKRLVSRRLNTKSGQLFQNCLVSNYSQQGARREARLGNLTVV
jgi:hypothetical protein